MTVSFAEATIPAVQTVPVSQKMLLGKLGLIEGERSIHGITPASTEPDEFVGAHSLTLVGKETGHGRGVSGR